MKTTVVIINWNGEKYIDNLLSYFEVNYEAEPCEVLIVDNKSTDTSLGLISNHNCKLLSLNYNWGFAIGNNIGGAVVETENILFMNNDMLPKGGFVKAMEDKCTSRYPIVGAKLIFGETKEIAIDNICLKTDEGKL